MRQKRISVEIDTPITPEPSDTDGEDDDEEEDEEADGHRAHNGVGVRMPYSYVCMATLGSKDVFLGLLVLPGTAVNRGLLSKMQALEPRFISKLHALNRFNRGSV